MRTSLSKAKRILGILITLVLVLAVPISVYLINNRTAFFLTARGEPANLSLDVSASRVVATGHWRNFAQGGEGDRAGLGAIIPQMRELEPNYIRIDHIYDRYNTVKIVDGRLVFNWTELDLEVDAILATGARPFLSLSYFPPGFTASGEIDTPLNWTHWQETVKETVEHYSGINNKNIQNVYYEVWNEPDLFGNFKTYGEKNYLELYRFSAVGAMSAQDVNSFRIGGPATTSPYPNWFSDLMAFTLENDLPLNFLSWHRYSYNLDDYASDITIAQNAVDQFPDYANMEFVISEMGVSSENDTVYDSKTSAIHSLASLSLLDQKVSKAFTFELQDGEGPEKYWGRWGMLTHSKFPPIDKKPRFSAFPFMNQLIGRYVEVMGQGTWIKGMARFDGNTLRIVVSNFDPANKHFETVPIKITNLEDGQWIFRRKDFLGQTRENNISIENGEFSVSELFNPNSAAILELERLE